MQNANATTTGTKTTVWPLVYVGSCCRFTVVRQCSMKEEHIWCCCCAHRGERAPPHLCPAVLHSSRPVWDEKYSAAETKAVLHAQTLRPTAAKELSLFFFFLVASTLEVLSKSNEHKSRASLLCTSGRITISACPSLPSVNHCRPSLFTSSAVDWNQREALASRRIRALRNGNDKQLK